MATSTLAEIQTGHELGLAYLSDIPAVADTIAQGANIVITTAGTVKTINATVPIQTITNGQNITVSYDPVLFKETITGVSGYTVSATNALSTGISVSGQYQTPSYANFGGSSTALSALPTAHGKGFLQVDVLNLQATFTTNAAFAPLGAFLVVQFYDTTTSTQLGQSFVPFPTPTGSATTYTATITAATVPMLLTKTTGAVPTTDAIQCRVGYGGNATILTMVIGSGADINLNGAVSSTP